MECWLKISFSHYNTPILHHSKTPRSAYSWIWYAFYKIDKTEGVALTLGTLDHFRHFSNFEPSPASPAADRNGADIPIGPESFLR